MGYIAEKNERIFNILCEYPKKQQRFDNKKHNSKNKYYNYVTRDLRKTGVIFNKNAIIIENPLTFAALDVKIRNIDWSHICEYDR